MPLGGSNQAVASDTPSFKAANAHPVPRPPWPGVRAGQSPVILGFAGLEPKVIHDHAKIREGSHEGLRYLGDCAPPDGRRAIIDTQRPLMRVACSNALGSLAAPCRCVARRQVPQVDRVRQHGNRFYQTRARKRISAIRKLCSSRSWTNVPSKGAYLLKEASQQLWDSPAWAGKFPANDESRFSGYQRRVTNHPAGERDCSVTHEGRGIPRPERQTARDRVTAVHQTKPDQVWGEPRS